ncbi:MAG: endolytic transglycosylase MltG [Pseudomonadales bacterium]
MKTLLSVLGGLVLALLIAAGYVHSQLSKPATLSGSFAAAQGEAAFGIVTRLHGEGLIDTPPALLKLAAFLTADAGQFKAGEYDIAAGLSSYELLALLRSGRVRQYSLTFPEGWRFAQWRRRLDSHPALVHTSADMTEAALAKELAIEGELEGWFFPDTYHFAKGESDLALLRRAHLLMRAQLDELWAAGSARDSFDRPYEALILASIIEKETALPKDRGLVASVFHNRLDGNRMRLQSDPTVIYGLGEAFDGNLTRRHLKTDGAYNTYTRDGLPPSPICMPGRGSILAALNPTPSDYLYFVATGKGQTRFSATLREHNRAVTKYQRSKQP